MTGPILTPEIAVEKAIDDGESVSMKENRSTQEALSRCSWVCFKKLEFIAVNWRANCINLLHRHLSCFMVNIHRLFDTSSGHLNETYGRLVSVQVAVGVAKSEWAARGTVVLGFHSRFFRHITGIFLQHTVSCRSEEKQKFGDIR